MTNDGEMTGDRELRDISEEIKKRVELLSTELDALMADKAKLDAQINAKSEEFRAATLLYESEKDRWAQMRLPLSRFTHIGLARACMTLLAEEGDMSVADLKRALHAADYPFHTVPGRAVHMALVGLQKRGLASKRADGKWRLAGPLRTI